MHTQYMPDTSSSNLSGINPGYGPPVPAPVQARPRPLNYAAGKGIYWMLATCTIILLLRTILFDAPRLIGRTSPPLPNAPSTIEAGIRYKRYLLWCALPDLITLSFGSTTLVNLNRCSQSTSVVLWSIFCCLSLEPLGFDIYNAWDSYNDPRFEKYTWFFLLLVLYRVVVIVVSLIFLRHLMGTVNENQRVANEGGVEGGVPPQKIQYQIQSDN